MPGGRKNAKAALCSAPPLHWRHSRSCVRNSFSFLFIVSWERESERASEVSRRVFGSLGRVSGAVAAAGDAGDAEPHGDGSRFFIPPANKIISTSLLSANEQLNGISAAQLKLWR